ncbi:MAG: hypothetical protein HMLIMOIP_001144 [Candidatus Nitrosomirales archaeon]|jgi:hypothetical protein
MVRIVLGHGQIWAVVLATVLVFQVASYNSYNESFPSIHAYSTNTEPESRIGKGYVYDASFEITTYSEKHLAKERISTTVSKYNPQTGEFTLTTVITGDYDGQKQIERYENVTKNDPFSNANINRQYLTSSIIDFFTQANFTAELHIVTVKPVEPTVIELQGSKYIGVLYEMQAILDLTYHGGTPAVLSFDLEEKDKIFPESGLVYQSDATLLGLKEDASVSLKYHIELTKTDIPAGTAISTQTLNSETVAVSEAGINYEITFLQGDDTTIRSKELRFDDGYVALNYETKPYAKKAVITILLPNKLVKVANLNFSSSQLHIDNNKQGTFILTVSDPDVFINLTNIPLGQHEIKFSFTKVSKREQVTSEKITPEEQTKVIAKYQESGDVIMKTPLQINMVMVGSTWSGTDEIQKQLLKSYRPVIGSQNRTVGVEFVYNYNFIDMSASLSKELFSYINATDIESSTDIPVSLIQWLTEKYKAFSVLRDTEGHYYLRCLTTQQACNQLPYGVNATSICLPEACGLYRLNYKWIDASLLQDWIHNKGMVSEGYTIFFLRPSNQMDYLHTYGITTADSDSGKEFRQEGMMGFGGKYRFYFIDLTAGPSFYPDVPIPTIAKVFHKNLFDTRNDQEYRKLIADYANDAIIMLFTPSYLYEPIYKSKYFLDVFIIDKTAGRFATIGSQYLATSRLESSLKSLIPYTEWNFNIESKSFDWLKGELKRAISKSMSIKTVKGVDTVRIDSTTLTAELRDWARSILTPEKMEELEKKESVYLPVIILLFDEYPYIDDGAVGIAIPDATDPSSPCCVFITTQKSRVLDFDAGLTSITVHEIGHLLGLMHPHDGYREDVKDGWFQNWFFDWSSTTMTYASPLAYGCGELIQDESGNVDLKECGMSISTFNQFNYDAIDRGLILHLLRQTFTNVKNTLEVLQKKGYVDSLPSSVENGLLSVDQDILTIEEQFVKMNYSSKPSLGKADNSDNALDLGLLALQNSRVLLKQADELQLFVPKQETGQTPKTPQEPEVEKKEVTEEEDQEHDISVAMKLKKKSALLAIKNTGNTEIYSVKIKASDGNIRYVKAKGWDREKIDTSTVMIKTIDRPLVLNKTLIIILISDNRNSSYEWFVYDENNHKISDGLVSHT